METLRPELGSLAGMLPSALFYYNDDHMSQSLDFFNPKEPHRLEHIAEFQG